MYSKKDQIKKLHSSLDEIYKIAHIGIWEMDAQTLQVTWSEEIYNIVGRLNDNSTLSYDLKSLVSNEDYKSIYASLMETLKNGKKHQIIYEIHRLDNAESRWIECRAHRETDKQGNAVKLIGTFQDITTQYMNERHLSESRKQFKRIFENAQVGMMLISEKRILLQANQRLADILGYTNPKEMEGISMRELHLSEERYITFGKEYFDNLQLGVKHNIQYQLKRKDGSAVWTELSGATMDDQIPVDMSKGILWTVNDISLQKQYQEEIAKTELLKKNVLSTVPDMIWLKDTEGTYITCNPEFERFFGAKEEQIAGKTDYDFVDKELADFFREHDKKAMEADKPLKNEEWINYASDGRHILLETTKTPLKDESGTIVGILGIGHDITQRQERIEALHEAKVVAERLSKEQSTLLSLFSKGDAVLFKWVNSDKSPVEYVSKSVEGLFGYTEKEFVEEDVVFTSLIHPDDLKHVGDEVQQALKNKSDFFKHDPYRIITKEKQLKWVLDYTATEKDKEGNITHFIGYILDITAEKNREKIREFKQELEEFVHKGDKDKLLRRALDEAEEMTRSQIGFFHFVEDDEESVSLQVWSTNTLSKMCFAEGHSMHYPISQAGVWVDCVHQRQAVICNDYANHPRKKNLPEGHAPLFRFATIPLFRQEKIVAIIGLGNKEVDYTQSDVDVITRIVDVAYDMYERQHAEERVEYMAYYDMLSGLPNRSLLTDRLNHSIAMAKRNNKLLAFCYLDLDDFKPVNDQYGHHIGDQLLIAFSKRVSKALRAGDTMARLGGDEFAIVLSELSSPYEAEDIIERILEIIKMPFDIASHRIHISCSIGITLYPTDQVDSDTLIRHADQAMYQAKAEGRSSFRVYNPVKDEHLRQRQILLDDFTQAIREDHLVLHYQPKVDLRDGTVFGFESLVRWEHPTRGMLYPGEFLPIIENTPQELNLGEWVINKALSQLNSWYEEGETFILSVNISPRQIQLQGFVDFLTTALQKYPKKLVEFFELEILEIAIIRDLDNLSDIMHQCKTLGIHFSLDDFGTGYSSLTYFHRLPIDILKIDLNFVREMLDNAGNLDIVEGILHMAETLDRPVIAEGVESVEIGLMLLYLGCQYAQGYGIAKPMPVEEVAVWLASWKKEDVWRQLHSEATGSLSHYDLSVAIFSHRRWLDKISRFVHGKSTTLPLLNEQQCQFAHWYRGSGQARYGTRESYAFVQAKHHKVHETAIRIQSLMESGEIDVAKKALETLYEDGEELTSLMQKMSKQLS